MQWTSFDPHMLPPEVRRTHVTLDPRGVFYLNHGAMFDLGYPMAVRLMSDMEARLIGIEAAPLRSKNSIELNRKYGADSPSRVFHARLFCVHLGILPERTIQFNSPTIENGVLVLDLKTTSDAPRRGVSVARLMELAGWAPPNERNDS